MSVETQSLNDMFPPGSIVLGEQFTMAVVFADATRGVVRVGRVGASDATIEEDRAAIKLYRTSLFNDDTR